MRNRFTRIVPTGASGTTETISALEQLEEPIHGWTNVKREQFSQYGSPATPIKLAYQVGNTNEGEEFPDDGTGILPSNPAITDGTTLQLASDVLQSQETTLDPTGLLVVIRTGSEAIGEIRQITGWNDAPNQIVNVNRGWDTGAVPQAAATYWLLLDLDWLTHMHYFVEYSENTGTATWLPILFSWPYAPDVDGVAFAPRVPWRAADMSYAPPNFGFTQDPQETGYYQGGSYSQETKGFVGAKLRLVTLAAGLTCSLWGVAT
jgi:hypothetical protein